MIAWYLYTNALLYAVFAAWCALKLDATSQNLGYAALTASGRTEYLAVYGGLQWGLALAFLLFATKPEWHRLGLLVSLALYAPIVLHRAIGLLRYGPVERMTYAVAALEIALLAAAVLLWFFAKRG